MSITRSPDQTTAGFSCSKELKAWARDRARQQGRSFSGYICRLIEADKNAQIRNKPVTHTPKRQRIQD